MKDNFRGFNTVFGFTFSQTTKGTRFKLLTGIVSIVIIGLCILVNILSAKPDETQSQTKAKNSDYTNIQSIHVVDNTVLAPVNFNEILSQNSEHFNSLQFIYENDKTREEVIDSITSQTSLILSLNLVNEVYDMELIIPNNSLIEPEEAETLIEPLTAALEYHKVTRIGLSTEELMTLMTPTNSNYTKLGEDTNIITILVKLLAPALFGLLLYFMLLFYGQNVSKSVSTEKTSKLMEALLTSVHPYALISGKIIAITSVALLQLITWIASLVIGVYAGNAIAQSIYPEYQNSILTVIEFIRSNIGQTAMTLPAFVLGIIIFCIGFLFYCVLAGLAGCMVSKPEDVASTQAVYVYPILISWLFCYIASLNNMDNLLAVLRFIPFTIPFCVPIDLITGTIGFAHGIVSLLALTVLTLITIMYSARIYKGLVLYNGQKLNLKMIGKIISSNK